MGASPASRTTDTFGIYLLVGCVSWPDLGDRSQSWLQLSSPAMQKLLVQQPPEPGFLGLDLPFADVTALLGRLRSGGAAGQVAPAAYRQPRVSIDDALVLAQPVLVQRAPADFAGYQFGPVMLWREEARWWVIGTVSEQLLDEGHIPGGVSIAVDKLDGHLWTFDEMDLLIREDRP